VLGCLRSHVGGGSCTLAVRLFVGLIHVSRTPHLAMRVGYARPLRYPVSCRSVAWRLLSFATHGRCRFHFNHRHGGRVFPRKVQEYLCLCPGIGARGRLTAVNVADLRRGNSGRYFGRHGGVRNEGPRWGRRRTLSCGVGDATESCTGRRVCTATTPLAGCRKTSGR